MVDCSAVVIGASGGIGLAVANRLETTGHYKTVYRFSRSATGLDLENEASIAAAAGQVSQGPSPSLIFVATGVLHDGHDPERSVTDMA